MVEIRLKLPDIVHEELSQYPGGKKPNAERILIEWAKKHRAKRKKEDERITED